MTPFQEFRFWSRRAPLSERVTAGVAGAVAIALLGWLVIPGGDDDGSGDLFASGRSAAGAEGEALVDGELASDGTADGLTDEGGITGATGAAGGTAGGAAGRAGTTARGVTGGAAGGAGGCVSPPGSTKGASGSEIKIALGGTNIVGPAANSVFGIPHPDDQRAIFDAVIKGINADGGVACRKLVGEFFAANPADPSQMQQQCLQIAEGGFFAVADSGSYTTNAAAVSCFAQRQVPLFGGHFLSNAQVQQFYPYLFSFYTFDNLFRDTAFALKDRGFFNPAGGFRKLGFLYRDCQRQSIEAFRGSLREAGLADSQVVTYNLGCPSGFARPDDVSQAVLTFQREGATHVTMGNAVGDIATFTRIAQQQNYRPKYGLPDEALISISYGNTPPDPENMAGAITITQSRQGEERTAGMQKSAGTLKCDAVLKAGGRKSTYEEAAFAGNACSQLWMFKAAVENAPSLAQAALAAGLQKAKSVEFSFPQGPNRFDVGPRVTTGGQFWRAAEFKSSCRCWQLVQQDFRPSYK